MAFPWIFAANFEVGALVDSTYGWDSETDTGSQLDICHYTELARYPWPTCAPFSGAYVARVVLTGGTSDAFVKEADIDIADAGTSYFKFELWFAPNFTATSNDTFAIFELQGAASAVTVSMGGRVVASTNVINLGIGGAASAAAPSTFAAQDIQRGVWYTVELKVVIQTGGTGTVDMYLTKDGEKPATAAHASVATITNIVVTDGVLGIQDQLATTTGVFLLDNFVQDDGRIYPKTRYRNEPVLAGVTESGHVFVGPGWIAGAAILGGTSPTMILYDTDRADVTAAQSYEVSLATTSTNQSSLGVPIYFQRGCYVVLGGTAPIGQVLLSRTDTRAGAFGTLNYSDFGVRRLALGG